MSNIIKNHIINDIDVRNLDDYLDLKGKLVCSISIEIYKKHISELINNKERKHKLKNMKYGRIYGTFYGKAEIIKSYLNIKSLSNNTISKKDFYNMMMKSRKIY